MNELSLFSGAGGGLLGTLLMGWRPIGYVEINDYCQRVIAARIKDGFLPRAPIFGDVRAFICEGYAKSYSGLVDVITAGFPCQPFSVAGKRAGADDARNMWPETVECIRLVRPHYALLENVRGLLTSGYFGQILGDLAASGYDARWRILSAAELGAPHRRDRIWIVANANKDRRGKRTSEQVEKCRSKRKTDTGEAGKVHNADRGMQEEFKDEQQVKAVIQLRADVGGCDKLKSRWWDVEPELGRVAHGVAHRVDRLGAISNGQVPAVVRAAWQLLGG